MRSRQAVVALAVLLALVLVFAGAGPEEPCPVNSQSPATTAPDPAVHPDQHIQSEMAHGVPQAAIPTSGVCSGPPEGKTYRDVVASWPRRYWHGSLSVSVAYDTALRCLGGYFTQGIDTRQRQSIWSKRAVTKEHPFGFALHGGVPPQRNIAQGAFIAALLGLRDAANFTAETIERVGAWLPKEPHGPLHPRGHNASARPDIVVESGCGMAAMLALACPPPRPPPEGQRPHEKSMPSRCFGADAVPEQIAHGQRFLPHLSLTTSLSLAHIPTGYATAALSHGVQTILTQAEFCAHMADLLRVLRPGDGTLVVWMLTPLSFGSRIHPAFFLDNGVSFPQCPPSMLPQLAARIQNTTAPLSQFANAEVLLHAGGAMYPASYIKKGFFGVRVTRTATPWPPQTHTFDGRTIQTEAPPPNAVERAFDALRREPSNRSAWALVNATRADYETAVLEAARRGVVNKRMVDGRRRRVFTVGNPSIKEYPDVVTSWRGGDRKA